MQHVATWKEGDDKWAYHEDAFAHIATHKVSLDPYRMESRKILACIKDVLPPSPLQRVEKASVDEVFLDLSAHVHSILLERYPEISGPAPYDDPTEWLPRPHTTALDWDTNALVDLDNTETEEDDPDWDDIAMLVGSEIIHSVRSAILQRLKYTCSAGIACNKMIAKLGSAHKKPNQQTIVRNRAVQQFLGNLNFTKIRNLGGKLGEEVVAKFGTDQVKELLNVSMGQLKSKIGDDTGSWVYETIRGNDFSEVNSRTQIRSMLSAKSFRPTINSIEQAERWLRIFVADIFSRLVEEGVLEKKRRPKTINLHHRQGGQMRSRQAPIPSGKAIDESMLFSIAKTLLGQIIVDGRAWPCSNLQLSVGGFEEGLTGNRGIGSFLVRSDEIKALKHSIQDSNDNPSRNEASRTEKRPRVENVAIKKFTSMGSRDESEDVTANNTSNSNPSDSPPVRDEHSDALGDMSGFGSGAEHLGSKNPNGEARLEKSTDERYHCKTCDSMLAWAGKEEHEDWHFAKSVQAQEKYSSVQPQQSAGHPKPVSSLSHKKTGNHKAKLVTQKREKGQSRLAFDR
ncbi:MAG: hypothetical protein LQ351_002167 [Letrouitia transgressa]|nr:MAG: hypothetical protein LQ351_002167 [Letrouitia transgressa]